jgi:hypothetical protein
MGALLIVWGVFILGIITRVVLGLTRGLRT